MRIYKSLPLIKGAIKHIPGIKLIKRPRTGGTIESRYCYTVWMRHLYNWNTVRSILPKNIAELGPGDSLGIGLSALLSGCESIYAFDIIKYWNIERNLRIFNELVELFKQKKNIPDNMEYPRVKPEIDNYYFPQHLITESILESALSKERLDLIRNEIINIDNATNKFIKYQIPWFDSSCLEKESVDFIYSQAVLEHVEDLETTYSSMKTWLKPSGLMSHTIDLKSHNITQTWNGHWSFTDWEWKVVKGGRDFLINRQPCSHHLNLHSKYGFKILKKSVVIMDNNLQKKKIAKKFKELSEEDLTVSGLYVLSQKN